MKPDEMPAFSKTLATHFPYATDEDCSMIWEQCKPFALSVALSAVERHHGELGAKVFRPNPARLGSLCRSLAGNVDSPDVVRTAERLRHDRAEAKVIEETWNAVENVIAQCSDETLERYRQAAIQSYPQMKPFWAKANFRASRPLMGAIVGLMKSDVAATV